MFNNKYITWSHINNTPYKLLPWIDKNKLNLRELSTNPRAIGLLERNPGKIHWG